MLYRYADWSGADTSAAADLTWFADGNAVAFYADDAMAWAVAEGLIQGVSQNQLAPQSSATRAQIAQILMRWYRSL